MRNDHPPALYHLPVRECFPDVWFASSAISMAIPLKGKITFSRNMVAVRGSEGWVLLNPIRLSESAEAELLAKAPFKHAVRLGTYHGRDDRYYVDKFGVEFWGVPGVQMYPEPRFNQEITEEGPFPIPGAQVVIFKDATHAECVVCLPQHRLLVTCDSVQHYEHDSLISALGKIVMSSMGFFTPCVIGPPLAERGHAAGRQPARRLRARAQARIRQFDLRSRYTQDWRRQGSTCAKRRAATPIARPYICTPRSNHAFQPLPPLRGGSFATLGAAERGR